MPGGTDKAVVALLGEVGALQKRLREKAVQIAGTLARREEGFKVTHTFNPKSSARAREAFSKFLAEKQRQSGARESFFKKKEVHRRRSSIFDFSDQSMETGQAQDAKRGLRAEAGTRPRRPPIKKPSIHLPACGAEESERPAPGERASPPPPVFEVYSEGSGEEEARNLTSLARGGEVPPGDAHRQSRDKAFGALRSLKKGGEGAEELRPRVKTAGHLAPNPFLFPRSSTVRHLKPRTPKLRSRRKLEKWMHQMADVAIDEESPGEALEPPASSGLKRETVTSIAEAEATPPRRAPQEPALSEDPARKFWSENVLDQMGRAGARAKELLVRVGDFRVTSELGRGHFGKVVRVRHARNQDEFAVKLIPMARSLDPIEQENLSSEARILQLISSPFVVKAFYW